MRTLRVIGVLLLVGVAGLGFLGMIGVDVSILDDKSWVTIWHEDGEYTVHLMPDNEYRCVRDEPELLDLLVSHIVQGN